MNELDFNDVSTYNPSHNHSYSDDNASSTKISYRRRMWREVERKQEERRLAQELERDEWGD